MKTISKHRFGKFTQLVRESIACADDPNSVPSLHVGGLRTAYNSQGSLMTSAGLCVFCIYMLTQKYTYIYRYKIKETFEKEVNNFIPYTK